MAKLTFEGTAEAGGVRKYKSLAINEIECVLAGSVSTARGSSSRSRWI